MDLTLLNTLLPVIGTLYASVITAVIGPVVIELVELRNRTATGGRPGRGTGEAANAAGTMMPPGAYMGYHGQLNFQQPVI